MKYLKIIFLLGAFLLQIVCCSMLNAMDIHKAYAVFNATKDTSFAEITKIYKKRLQDWNPDQYTDNAQKLTAIKITEVLKNAYQMIKAYTILDITPDTSFEEIKKKYKKLSKQLHPDIAFTKFKNEERKKLNEQINQLKKTTDNKEQEIFNNLKNKRDQLIIKYGDKEKIPQNEKNLYKQEHEKAQKSVEKLKNDIEQYIQRLNIELEKAIEKKNIEIEDKFKELNAAYETIETYYEQKNNSFKSLENFSESIVDPDSALDLLKYKITDLSQENNLFETLKEDKNYKIFVKAFAEIGIKYHDTNVYLKFINNYIIKNAGWWFIEIISEHQKKFKSPNLTALEEKIVNSIIMEIIKNINNKEEFCQKVKKHTIFNSLSKETKQELEKYIKEPNILEQIEQQASALEKKEYNANDLKNFLYKDLTKLSLEEIYHDKDLQKQFSNIIRNLVNIINKERVSSIDILEQFILKEMKNWFKNNTSYKDFFLTEITTTYFAITDTLSELFKRKQLFSSIFDNKPEWMIEELLRALSLQIALLNINKNVTESKKEITALLYCVKLYGIKDKEFEHYQNIILFYEALQNIKGSPDIIKSDIIKEIKKHNLEITSMMVTNALKDMIENKFGKDIAAWVVSHQNNKIIDTFAQAVAQIS